MLRSAFMDLRSRREVWTLSATAEESPRTPGKDQSPNSGSVRLRIGVRQIANRNIGLAGRDSRLVFFEQIPYRVDRILRWGWLSRRTGRCWPCETWNALARPHFRTFHRAAEGDRHGDFADPAADEAAYDAANRAGASDRSRVYGRLPLVIKRSIEADAPSQIHGPAG